MKKRYLKTVEDVLALKDTDTRIYSEIDKFCELKFIGGILCKIDKVTHCIDFNIDIYIDPDNDVLYVLEPMQEATENDVGKLCKFWDEESEPSKDRILVAIRKDCEYRYVDTQSYSWKHCRRLTPPEVAEITGYKVEEAE